jgi:SAM-dependent methyltransferase
MRGAYGLHMEPEPNEEVSATNNNRRIVPNCPACNGSRSRSFSADSFVYDVCGSCNSAWLNPAPYDTLSLYGPRYFNGAAFDGYSDYAIDADIHRANAMDRLNTVQDVSERQRTLLDVGCAFGFGLDAGRDAGWRVVGVEVSEHARAVAKSSGHEVVSAIGEIPAGQAFDLVVFAQVLEHMPDPLAALNLARERMADAGTLLVETWNRDSRVARIMGSRWQQVSPPSVLHLFTERGLRALLGRAGFNDVVVEPWSKRISVATVLGIVRGKTPSILGGPMEALENSAAVGRHSFNYRLRDLVLARGRRGTAIQ